MPFSSRFEELDRLQLTAYLVVLSGAALTTALVIAPVAFHRLLFRQHEKDWLVRAANLSARCGLVSLALTVSGVLFLVFDIVVGLVAGLVAMAVVAGGLRRAVGRGADDRARLARARARSARSASKCRSVAASSYAAVSAIV